MKSFLPSISIKIIIASVLGFSWTSAVELGELTGEPTPASISDYLTVSITGNTGASPDNESLGLGYWTSAVDTTNAANPTEIKTSFTFTATGLEVDQSVDITRFDFLYIRAVLNGSAPIMNVYLNSVDLGISDEVIHTVDSSPEGALETTEQTIHKAISLKNGQSVTIGFAYRDNHGAPQRTHMIDDFTVSGDLDMNRNVPGIDLNDNGVSDIWERRYNAESLVIDDAAKSADYDGDGVSNYDEAFHGTDPWDAESNFSLSFSWQAYSEGVITGDSPVAYWRLDALTGATVTDSSGNGNHATLIGEVELVDGVNGAYNFNGGVSPAVVDLPTSAFADVGDAFSIAFWVNGDASNQPRRDSCFAAFDSNGERILNIHLPWINGFVYWDAGGDRISKVASTAEYVGQWNHWAFTKDAISGEMSIYLNGQLWHSGTSFNGTIGDVDVAYLGGTSPSGGNYEGALDEVYVFSSALSQSEVQSLMGVLEPLATVETELGKHYQILRSEDLLPNSWNVEEDISGDGAAYSLLFQPDMDEGYERMFYRAEVLDVDNDGDGLTLYEESSLPSFSDDDATSVDGVNDYDTLKLAVQSAEVAEVDFLLNNGGILTEGGNELEITFQRMSPLGEEFLLFDFLTSVLPSGGFSSDDYVVRNEMGEVVTDSELSFASGVSELTMTFEAVSDNNLEADEEIVIAVEGKEATTSLWITQEVSDFTTTQQTAIAQAGHFLSQASMGGTRTEIAQLANEIIEDGLLTACENWIDAQIALPRESSVTDDCFDFQAAYLAGDQVPSANIQNFELVWWGKMVQTNEQLRHRVAYSLSQIFVTSSAFWANSERSDLWRSYTGYYDKLADAAFGTHRDLLTTISYDPFMGVYLSSVYNQKEDLILGTSPDENFAREVMQLFSCGVYSQDQSGNYLLNDGVRLENYDNSDITELAQVFTGLVLSDEENNIENINNPNFYHGNQYIYPMLTVESRHDTSTKILLDGTVLPAGQSVDQDISDALDVLAEHSSTAPHISRLLIKRLTNSNPSSAYIGRVSEAWRGEGQYGNGQIGDFVSVLKAILLDSEARDALSFSTNGSELTISPTANQIDGKSTGGRMKEPILKWTQFYRYAQSVGLNDDAYPRWSPLTKKASNDQTPDFGQIPMRAPSVFNYYASEFSPSVGALAEAEVEYGEELTSPESEILTPYVIKQFEQFYDQVNQDDPGSSFIYAGSGISFSTTYHYLDFLYDKHSSVESFLDDINLWFCNGQLSNSLQTELEGLANAEGGASRENFAALLSIIFNSSNFSVSY